MGNRVVWLGLRGLEYEILIIGLDGCTRDGNDGVCLEQMTEDGQGRVSGLLSKSSFVHQLNAKLAMQQQQHQHVHHQQQQHPALDAHQPRPGTVDHHESLMDQIRRGTSLRRARSTSDRSSPHFKH